MATTDGYYEDDLEISPEAPQSHSDEKPEKKSYFNKTSLTCVAIFLSALLVRLYFVFFVSLPDNPGAGWFGDSYHHWQIAYLTKEIGLKQSFLRLWDLKGMEYFWGILHPLLLVFLFTITGNTSMGLERSMTCVAGAISAVLFYLIGRKYWNEKVGLGAGIFAAFFTTSIFNDASGMIEPLGIPIILGAIYLWSKKPFLSGLLFALAITTRSEFWVFSIGLIVAYWIFEKKSLTEKKFLLTLGFAIPTAIYMKYLLDYTANPIYPFYLNYVANIYGTWQFREEILPDGLRAKFIFQIILAFTLFWTALCIWKRPRGWQFYLLGLGNWIFLGITIGLSAYVKSWKDFVWVVRFMILPYNFLGAVFCVFIFSYIPSKIKLFDKLMLNWLFLFAAIVAGQLIWYEIYRWYTPTFATWEKIKMETADIATGYKGGGFLIPEGNPEITYALVQFNNVKGKDIIGQMFDPYFYWEEKHYDPYANWNAPDPLSKEGFTYRETVLSWVKKSNIKYIVTYSTRMKYMKLFEIEKDIFIKSHDVSGTNFVVYSVDTSKI